jgi:hypothetical protein
MLGLLTKIPLRLYEYVGLALAIVLFVLWWDHTEIEKGPRGNKKGNRISSGQGTSQHRRCR